MGNPNRVPGHSAPGAGRQLGSRNRRTTDAINAIISAGHQDLTTVVASRKSFSATSPEGAPAGGFFYRSVRRRTRRARLRAFSSVRTAIRNLDLAIRDSPSIASPSYWYGRIAASAGRPHLPFSASAGRSGCARDGTVTRTRCAPFHRETNAASATPASKGRGCSITTRCTVPVPMPSALPIFNMPVPAL
jgi:hypothetical protein